MPPVNTFAGATIDRATARRTDPAWLAEQLEHPGARGLPASSHGPFVDCSSDPCRPALYPLAELGGRPEEPILLGLDGAGPVFAVDVEGRADSLPGSAMTLREAGARVSDEDAGLLAYATALLNWHRDHRFCARCGTPTDVAEAGHVRTCANCGAIHHPRIDPVIIVLVTDGDRALLGRQARWPKGRYSTLAGFVEPGESVEEAVAREVGEEAGVEVADVRYRSTQPWPFPSSLMIGFHARWTAGEPEVRDAELEDVRWFSRDELRAVARGETDLHLPPPVAIARILIDEWLAP
ncbi:MAG: diphosphatase [Thermoleophilaceae bacterium]|nr:diphosphatase [Thermoleophilaceae bacterium]